MSRQTPELIEEVALDLFGRLGYHATSMRMIAKGAQVQVPSLYHWYPSKEALLLSLIRQFLDDLTRAVSDAVEVVDDPVRRLAAAIRAHVIFHGENRLAAVVTDTEMRGLDEGHRQEVTVLRDSYQSRFFEMIEAGIQAGAFRPAWPRVSTFITLLAATSVDIWYRPDGELSLEDVADAHVEFILGGLRLDDASLESITSKRDAGAA